ncbi:MAG: hypothetical protein M0Z92_03570 [Actinomycetota bacterium]|nr:hypothetical protein [Actinomycetota bacterium]
MIGMAKVAERGEVLEVSDVTRRDLEEALRLLPIVQEMQASATAEARPDLLRALMRHQVPLTPPASVVQAQRLAAHRDALLATEVLTYEMLASLRGDQRVSSTRTWVTRQRKERRLFSVSHAGQAILPAFQFAAAGRPRPELQPLLAALIEAGVDAWELWAWLTSPSSWLSGEVPEELAGAQPERVLRAAQEFAGSAEVAN